MVPRPDASIASTFRTSDWDKPNCRAIREGVMPALKAARTAFTCPRVSDTATGCRLGEGLSIAGDRLPPSLRLREHHREQSVELLVIEVLDRAGQVPGQDVSLLLFRRR
jgi:hypothetical protein